MYLAAVIIAVLSYTGLMALVAYTIGRRQEGKRSRSFDSGALPGEWF